MSSIISKGQQICNNKNNNVKLNCKVTATVLEKNISNYLLNNIVFLLVFKFWVSKLKIHESCKKQTNTKKWYVCNSFENCQNQLRFEIWIYI